MGILTVTSLSDNGAGSLRQAVQLAQNGDTIKFASQLAGKTLVLKSGQLTIAAGKNLTIDAADASGLKISGNNTSRIFYVHSNQDRPASLNLKNVQIINGYTSEQGGAVYVAHKGKLSVENVTFQKNVAAKGGGAIYSAWETDLSATNTKFIANNATAANEETSGGAISFISPGKITVTKSEFTNNRGINGGAINSLHGKLTIQDSKFIGNDTTAGYYDTNSKHPFLRGYGGAIYTDRASNPGAGIGGTINISNSVFKNNKALAEGGAAYLYTDPKDKVSIDGSLFENNQVSALKGGTPGHGGAIVQLTNGTNKGFTIANSALINNRATSQGGGLWVMGAPTNIFNSTFSGNVASDPNKGRGGAMMLYSDTNIDNTTIAYNEVGWFGGGVDRGTNTKVSVSDSIFYKNTANNVWGIRQHVHQPLIDKGGNFQYPPEINSSYNVTNVIRTDVDPQLGALQYNGLIVPIYLVNNPVADDAGANSTKVIITASNSNTLAQVRLTPDLSSTDTTLITNSINNNQYPLETDPLLNQTNFVSDNKSNNIPFTLNENFYEIGKTSLLTPLETHKLEDIFALSASFSLDSFSGSGL